MAEFIFNLQRFSDSSGSKGGDSGSDGNIGGNGGSESTSNNTRYSSSGHTLTGTNAASGYSNSGHTQSGTGTGGSSGWETRIRKQGEIIFPMFMSTEEADTFSDYAYSVFTEAIADGTVSYYNLQDSIADSFDFSRLLSNSTILDNEAYDTINLVDTNVGNIIEYYTYKSGDLLSLVFDTGAILAFDIGQVSPWFNFANGESMVYSARQGKWLTGNEAETEFVFWNTAVQDSGDEDIVDNFYVTQGINTALLNVSSDDNILLYDTTSSDISYTVNVANSANPADYTSITFDSTEVTDQDITIYFPTGGALNVETDSTFSPNFYFADGTSYYYNRYLGEWRPVAYREADLAEYETYQQLNAVYEAYEAAVEKATFEEALYESGYSVVYEADAADAYGNYAYNFPVSCLVNSYVYDAGYYDTINLYDAVAANVVSLDAYGSYIDITYNTGMVTTIEYDYNFSPIIQFADGTSLGYDWYTETWGNAYYSNPLVEENLAISRSNNSLVYQADSTDTIYFTDAVAANITNAVTGTRYINLFFDTGAVVNVRYTDDETPTFVFLDGSEYVYDNDAETWYVSSADAASDMWGDVADTSDALFTDGAIAADATLSDLVAAPVDSAAVSFGAESAFDINAAGGFVAASTAIESSNKDA